MEGQLNKAQTYSRVYNFLMGLLYVLVFCCLGGFIAMGAIEEEGIAAGFLIILTACFTLPFAFAHFLLGWKIDTRSSFVYYTNIVVLALSTGSLITIVPGILILLEWIKPENRDLYLGKGK